MSRNPADFRALVQPRCVFVRLRRRALPRLLASLFVLFILKIAPANAVILWNDSASTLARDSGAGNDILGGAVKRDDSANDTLYFRFHLDPLSDANTEEYFAAFELYEADSERLGIGNAAKAWAYSAFFNAAESGESTQNASYIDLHSSKPEPSTTGAPSTYEFPRRGVERTILFKVQFVAGGDDLVTVWLDPDLGPGANEVYQPESLTTRFNANASFDEIRLRHSGGGGGWIFSDMAIATSFSDFADTSSAKPGGATPITGQGSLPFTFRSWQREQGMPHKSIRALAQTRDGYLWVGSDDGLARFDGVRFVSFDLRDGLRTGPVRSLLGGSRGELWIGTDGNGLTCLRDGKFSTFTKQNGLPSDSISALAEDNDGNLWIGTSAGLVLLRDGKFVPLNAATELVGKSITALFKDQHGTIWIGATGAGVFKFENGKLISVTQTSVASLLQDSHSLLVDRNERLWVGAGDDFVLCREGNQWRRYRIPRHSARPCVGALAEEPDGTIWAGSISEGLFQFKDGKLTAVNASSGLSDNLIESLLVDREGKLWVGTDSGLNELRRKNLFVFGREEGLGYGSVFGMAEVAPGVIWAAKPGDGLYRWQGKMFSRLTAAGLSPDDSHLSALLVTRDGGCWLACGRGLLHFKDPQAVADESQLAGLRGKNIISLAEDFQGRVWAGTRNGELWRLGAGKWLEQTNFWRSHAVTAIVPENNGSLWIGTDGNGLFQIKDNTPRAHFDKASGLLSDSIRTLFLANDGVLWIGTDGGGLSRWRDGHLATFTTRDGLPDNTISQILGDDDGRLWLGGNHGIACVSERELNEVAAGKIAMLFPHVYGRADGMESEECASGFFPAGLKTKSGLLWFSTAKGVVVADPHQHPANAAPPQVILENVLVDGIPARNFENAKLSKRLGKGDFLNVKTLRIPPGKHRFELQYTAISFDAPEQLRFRYRLEGLDSDWVDAGARRTAFYNYVPPGNYRFRVIARNRDGVWNESGASLALNISRHFWQMWWVVALGAMALLVSVGGTVRIVEKRKLHRRLNRLEQERALERERTRIAQDLHDEMGAKLCRISFLSEHARSGARTPSEVQDQIASISDASREVLHSLDEIVWAVNPQNDTFEHVASYIGQYAQDYFQMTGVECELDIPAQLPAHPLSSQARHHLFLGAHEAFTNILKHSKATRARVVMTCGAEGFQLIISDNGAGFDFSALKTANAVTADPGNGLRNMRQRLAEIGGICRVESKPGVGTTIYFILPLKEFSKER
jgi:ligand-binding sensor domain-containing protein/signal transduction histidine kinase